MKQFVPKQGPSGTKLEGFDLDLETAAELLPFVRKGPKGMRRLEEEAEDMAKHQPRWLLTVSSGRTRLACPKCKGMLIFEQGLRCSACGTQLPTHRLSNHARACWFGLLPPIGLSGLSKLDQALGTNGAPAGHVAAQHAELGRFLMVPLLSGYPPNYPKSPPQIRYLPGFFELPFMPPDKASHRVHLYGQGVLCLFASGQWNRKDFIRQVIEQRAYAHVIKMLNFANGKRRAFAKVS